MVKILTDFKINKPVMCAIQADIRFAKNSRIYFNIMHTITIAFWQDIARITHIKTSLEISILCHRA